jgi:CheY-like chemotaxis protein
MTTGVQQAAQPWREDPRPARRVLLVEDYDTVRQVLRCTLEEGGYQVIEARNGVEALSLCRVEEPDLVVTDLIMPDKDGLETIAELRQIASNLPVIAMSGGGRVGASLYLAVAETLGAALVLEKPFTGHSPRLLRLARRNWSSTFQPGMTSHDRASNRSGCP